MVKLGYKLALNGCGGMITNEEHLIYRLVDSAYLVCSRDGRRY